MKEIDLNGKDCRYGSSCVRGSCPSVQFRRRAEHIDGAASESCDDISANRQHYG